MQIVRPTSPIIAIACSDIHLALKAPLARSEEPNWFAAMERGLRQVRQLAERHKVPILCAGDIFDRWNSPPELINWALERLPTMYAIPGNHDLPNHRPELAHRSAYGTLVRAGRVIELGSTPTNVNGHDVYGRPFGEDIPHPKNSKNPLVLNILVTHQYLWANSESGHVGAPQECKLSKVAEDFDGYDVVIVGDNHVPFQRHLASNCHVFNCGGFMRRKSNEATHRPRVGLVRSKGIVSTHLIDCDKDIITQTTPEAEQQEEYSMEVEGVIKGLEELEVADGLSFREALVQALKDKKVRSEVTDAILEALE